jgi:hypothetical protein
MDNWRRIEGASFLNTDLPEWRADAAVYPAARPKRIDSIPPRFHVQETSMESRRDVQGSPRPTNPAWMTDFATGATSGPKGEERSPSLAARIDPAVSNYWRERAAADLGSPQEPGSCAADIRRHRGDGGGVVVGWCRSRHCRWRRAARHECDHGHQGADPAHGVHAIQVMCFVSVYSGRPSRHSRPTPDWR